MAKHNPFTNTQYDLGIDTAHGISLDTVSDNLLRTAYTNTPKCYACTAPGTHRIIAKDSSNTTVELQNGLFICSHCISQNVLDHKLYGIRSHT